MKKLSLMLLVSCAFAGSVVASSPEVVVEVTNNGSIKSEQALAALTTAGKTVVPGIAGYLASNALAGSSLQLPLLVAAVFPFVVNDNVLKNQAVATAAKSFSLGVFTQKALSYLPDGKIRSSLRVRS